MLHDLPTRWFQPVSAIRPIRQRMRHAILAMGTLCCLTVGIFPAYSQNQPPDTPSNLSPLDGFSSVTLPVQLQASAFADPDTTSAHSASQWQVRSAGTPSNYSVTTYDSAATTGALTSCIVPAWQMAVNATYYWHVRYRDDTGLWSPWSAETGFSTNQPPANSPPDRPYNLSPANGSTSVSVSISLASSAFADVDAGDTHYSSQWQIRRQDSPMDYSVTTFDSGVTTISKTSLGTGYATLDFATTYCWRVRYQDNHEAWSAWSEETSFTTGRASGNPPDTPVNQSPAQGETGVSLTPTLSATPFSDPDPGDTHYASHWQVRAASSPSDFSALTYDSNPTTGALASCTIPGGLLATGTAYCWRVRYRDNRSAWSAWSAETVFTTSNHAPNKPVNVSPANNGTSASLTPLLIATPFSDPDTFDIQAASQWQVRMMEGAEDYSTPAYDSGEIAGPQSSQAVPPEALSQETSYYWRARYKDNHGEWSPWSDETVFAPSASVNLPPAKPAGVFPIGVVFVPTGPFTAYASAFSDPDAGDSHAASQWIYWFWFWNLTPPQGGPWRLVYDSGPTSASLTSCLFSATTLFDAGGYWRVRYMDSRGAWSPWSDPCNVDTPEFNTAPDKPANLSPYPAEQVPTATPTLTASAFLVTGGAEHGGHYGHRASQWQVREAESAPDYSAVVLDYSGLLQDLTQYQVPASTLSMDRMYCWRVRYQASGNGWSAWSDDTSFTTHIAPNAPPQQPANISPSSGATGISLRPTLAAAAFSDPDAGDTHAGSQWQVRGVASSPDYSVLSYDSGVSSTSLTTAAIPAGMLDEDSEYAWHCRYQDSRGAWSDWSAETTFRTAVAGPPSQPTNLQPAQNESGVTITASLRASAFSSPTERPHTASWWQLREASSPEDWSSLVFESTSDTLNLTSMRLPLGTLDVHKVYYWRVMYMDSHGVWGPWSSPTNFATMIGYNWRNVLEETWLDPLPNAKWAVTSATPPIIMEGLFLGTYPTPASVASLMALPRYSNGVELCFSWRTAPSEVPSQITVGLGLARGGTVAAMDCSRGSMIIPFPPPPYCGYGMTINSMTPANRESAGTSGNDGDCRIVIRPDHHVEFYSNNKLLWTSSTTIDLSLDDSWQVLLSSGIMDSASSIGDVIIRAPVSMQSFGAPDKPANVAPANGQTSTSLTPLLSASAFSDPDPNDYHAASQWQVRSLASPSDYSVTAFDSGSDISRAHLVAIEVPADVLHQSTGYAWRVRYKDSFGLWSNWSDETSFTTGRTNSPPATPVNISPADGESSVAQAAQLHASAFSDADPSDTHAASQWQIRTISAPSDFSTVAYDSGETGTALTSVSVAANCLLIDTTYAWRVRYRDNRGGWSEWSTATSFTTGPCAPNTPSNVSPLNGAGTPFPMLVSSTFSDPRPGDTHSASQWQIRRANTTTDYSSTVFDIITTAPRLTATPVPLGRLDSATTYAWHARYRDNRGNWSAWSPESTFVTDEPADTNLAWSRWLCGGTGSDYAYGARMLPTGELLVYGKTTGSLVFGEEELNETRITSRGGTDIWLAKYDPTGRLIWARQAGGTGSEGPSGPYGCLTLTPDGGCAIVGAFTGNSRFGAGESAQTDLITTSSAPFIARYNPDGSLAWAKQGVQSVSTGFFWSVAARPDGSVAVCGQFNGTLTLGPGEAHQTTLVSRGSSDIMIALYGSNGPLLWATQVGGAGADLATRVISGPEQDITVAGNIANPGAVVGTSSTQEMSTNGAAAALFLARYRADGSLVWAKSTSGAAASTCAARSVAVGEDGSLFAAGYLQSGTVRFGPGEASETALTPYGSMDIFLARYAPDGQLVWAKRAGGTKNEVARDVLVHSDGTVTVAGSCGPAPMLFEAGTPNETALPVSTRSDYFMANYSPTGTFLRAVNWMTQDAGSLVTITAGPDDAVYAVAPYGANPAVFGAKEPNETTLRSFGTQDAFLAKIRIARGQPPAQPVNVLPAAGSVALGLNPTLSATPFSDPDTTDTHASSQWQVRSSTNPAGYSVPVMDSGADQLHLTSITLAPGRLSAGATYYWRVRYQDSKGMYSPWSAETRFTTARQYSGVEKIAVSAGMAPGSKFDILLTNPDGSGTENLTSDLSGDATEPRFSPDGQWIAFVAPSAVSGESSRQIWVMKPDGSAKSQITHSTDPNAPTLHGWISSSVLEYAAGSFTSSEIRRINIDGSGDATLVASPFMGLSSLRNARPSPDMTRIAVSADRDLPTTGTGIYLVESNGTGNGRTLYDEPTGTNADRTPVWSSDGTTLYWVHSPTSGACTDAQIVRKSIFSAKPADQWDETVGPYYATGARPYCLSPDDTSLLLVSNPCTQLKAMKIAGAIESTVLTAACFAGADWGWVADMPVANHPPARPANQSPASGTTAISLSPTLTSSAFSDADPGDTHAATTWQIRHETAPADYSAIAFDSGDTGTNLTQCPIPEGRLLPGSRYFWRSRYRDNHGDWSAWSDETAFVTTAAAGRVRLLFEDWESVASVPSAVWGTTLQGSSAPAIEETSSVASRSLMVGGGWQNQASLTWHRTFVPDYSQGIDMEFQAWLAGSGWRYTECHAGLMTAPSPANFFSDGFDVATLQFARGDQGQRYVRCVIGSPDSTHQESAELAGAYVSEVWNTGRIVIRSDQHAEFYVNGVLVHTTTKTVDPAFSGNCFFGIRGFTGDGPALCDNIIVNGTRANQAPIAPVNLDPATTAVNVALAPTLTASGFLDPDGDTHASSQWQVRARLTRPDYSETVFDSGPTPGGTTACAVPAGHLNYTTSYAWRARYRDSRGTWSMWSTETGFETAGQPNHPPYKPTAQNPVDSAAGIATTPRLEAMPFSDSDSGDFQTAAQFRIRTEYGSFEAPAFDSGEVSGRVFAHTVPETNALGADSLYYWQVRYRDSRNAWSEWSDQAAFHTAPADKLPAPDGFRAIGGPASVWLNWFRYNAVGLHGFYLYRATTPDGPWTDKLNSEPIRGTEYADTNVTSGTTYYYMLTAEIEGRGETEMSPVRTAIVGTASILMTDITGMPGATVSQTISVANPNELSGQNLHIEIDYDPAMLRPVAVNRTALTQSFSLSDNISSASGRLIVSGSGSSSSVRGEGNLLEILYEVNTGASEWARSPLSFSLVSLLDTSLNPVTVDYSDSATLTVSEQAIRGNLDNDTSITVSDRDLLVDFIQNGAPVQTLANWVAADINGDGLLDASDLVLLERMLANAVSTGSPSQPAGYPSIAHKLQVTPPVGHHLRWQTPTYSGDRITVTATIDEQQDVAGMGMQVLYSPACLRLVETQRGTAFADAGTWDLSTGTPGEMRLLAGGATASQTGGGTVLTFTFQKVGSWTTTPLSVIEFKVCDLDGVNLDRTRDVDATDASLSSVASSEIADWQMY